jgi:hypothetical protein
LVFMERNKKFSSWYCISFMLTIEEEGLIY